MLGLDENVIHALVSFAVGVVLTLLIILLVDFLYRKAVYMAQARLASRLDAVTLMEMSKLDDLEAMGKAAAKSKSVKAMTAKTEPITQVRELDLDEPIDVSDSGEPTGIYPPEDEQEAVEPPNVEEYQYLSLIHI